MRKYSIFIFLAFFPFESFSQWVDTPEGPNLIDWQEDHERMRKAKVKEVRVYMPDRYGKKIISESFEFDTMGHIIKETEMRDGKLHTYDSTVWTPGYNSYQIFRYMNDKNYCFRKENFDRHGYTTQTYLGQPDGSFELQGSYSYDYNKDGSVNHVSGDWYGQKTESFYTYDKNGNMTTAKELTEDNPEWNWEYTYDSLGRLIKEYWWEKEGKDTSMVALSYWTWNSDGTIQKEEGKGRGWKDIHYEWKGDSLKIDFRQGPEFGPSYKYIMRLSSDKKLVNYMLQTSPKGWKEEELWYEYSFY